MIRPGARLGEGAVVRASVLARLLGIRLLRLEADIALLPASFQPADRHGPTPVPTGDLSQAAQLLAHASRTLDATPDPNGSRTWDAT